MKEVDRLEVRWSWLVGQGGGRDKVYSGRPIPVNGGST